MNLGTGSRSASPTDGSSLDAHRHVGYLGGHSGKRYLTGAELVILMTLGGISRLRSNESTTKRFNSAEERSNALKLYDRLLNVLSAQRTLGRMPGNLSKGDLRVVVKHENKGVLQLNGNRPSGSEIAVSALIALASTARIRQDDFLSQLQVGGTIPVERFIDVSHQRPNPYSPAVEHSAQAVRRILNGVEMLPPKERTSVAPPPNNEDINDNPASADSGSSKDETQTAQLPLLRRREWLVSPGETLTGLGARLYEDPVVGWLIADLNAGKIMENWVGDKRIVEIQSRQSLYLPTPDEVDTFYQTMAKSVNPDNLVTVIAERQIDLEIAQSDLKVLFGNAAPTCASLPLMEISDNSDLDES